MGRYVWDNPEEAIAGVVEFLVPLKAGSLVKLKQVQTVVKAFQEQKQIAEAIQLTTNLATKITTPLKEILVDASAVVSVGLEHGKDAVRNLITVAQQQPEITSVGDIVTLRGPGECFNDFEKLSREVAACYEKVTSKEFEILESIGNGEWKSPQGLIYGQGSKHGNRINHILEHANPNPSKPLHSVFNTSKNDVLSLIDEAWAKRTGVKPIIQANGNAVYNIKMGRIIGTDGETQIRIVVESNTSKIVTAFPVKAQT